MRYLGGYLQGSMYLTAVVADLKLLQYTLARKLAETL